MLQDAAEARKVADGATIFQKVGVADLQVAGDAAHKLHVALVQIVEPSDQRTALEQGDPRVEKSGNCSIKPKRRRNGVLSKEIERSDGFIVPMT